MYHRFDDPNVFLRMGMQRARAEEADRQSRFDRWKSNIRASSPRFQLKHLLTEIKAARQRVDALSRNYWRTTDPVADVESIDANPIVNAVPMEPKATRRKSVHYTRADGTAVIAYGVDPRKGLRK